MKIDYTVARGKLGGFLPMLIVKIAPEKKHHYIGNTEILKYGDALETARQWCKESIEAGQVVISRTIDNMDYGEQTVLAGAEKIGERQLIQRRMEAPKRSSKPQQGADFGLFDNHTQKEMF